MEMQWLLTHGQQPKQIGQCKYIAILMISFDIMLWYFPSSFFSDYIVLLI